MAKTEPDLRAQIYELAMQLVPARCTFKSRKLSLYRHYSKGRKFTYCAVIGIAWNRPRAKKPGVAFVDVTGAALTTRTKALAALVVKLRAETK